MIARSRTSAESGEAFIDSLQPRFGEDGRLLLSSESSQQAGMESGSPMRGRFDRESFLAALARLPRQYRQAYLLRDGAGWTLPEVARHLGIDEDRAARLVHRARCALVTLLHPDQCKSQSP